MLIYRLLRTTTKIHVKILHALIQVVVLVFASIALKAVFDSHNKKVPKPIPNMYSLHSWVGLSAVILFGLQWVFGFVSFLFPRLSDGIRRWYMVSSSSLCSLIKIILDYLIILATSSILGSCDICDVCGRGSHGHH